MTIQIWNRIILCKNATIKYGENDVGRKLKFIGVTLLLLFSFVGCNSNKVLEDNITNKDESIESSIMNKDELKVSNITSSDESDNNITSKDESLEKDNLLENRNSSEMESQEGVSNNAVLLNEEETKLEKILEGFSEAYFRGDKEGMSLYLTDEVDIEDYNYMMNKTDIYDTTEIMDFKGDISNVNNVDKIEVQYPFKLEGADSITYLGIELIKISEEWIVSNFYLEK